MSKKLLALLMACIMVLGLAACGGKGEEAGNKDGENVTLTFAYKQVDNDPLEKFFETYDIIAEFEKAHPGVKVELKPVSSTEGDYGTLMALQLSSAKTAPDMFMEDTYMTATDAAAGYLACLDDYVANWEDWAHYLEGAKTAVKGVDGKTYGIPISTDSRGIYYNMAIFQEAGIETPWQPTCWADIIEAGKKITALNKGYEPFYLIVGGGNGEAISMQTFEMLLYGTGDQLYEDGKWVVDSQSIVDTFQFIDDVYNNEKIGIDGGIAFAAGAGDKMAELMSQNKGAMFLSTCTDSAKWSATGSFPVEDVESKIGYAAMPTQNGGNPATVTMCGGWSWAVSEFSENKDLAFEFLAFCGNKENAARRSLLDGRMCPRDDAGEVEGYADRAYVEEMTAFMANAYVRPKSEDYALVTTEIQRLVEMVANDSFTPEQAAAEYATNVKNIVGEENTITK
jgi:multiple sugar transport system substrate-binding protein